MNRIAVLAAKYVRDPVKAVEDLESFRERVWDVVEFDHERKEWRYSLPTDEACSFYVQFDDCVRAVGLAKERNETLAEFSFDKWRAAVLSVNPMGISDGSGARRDFVSAMSNTYDDLQLIKTKMELSRLLDTGDSVRKSRKSPRKNGPSGIIVGPD